MEKIEFKSNSSTLFFLYSFSFLVSFIVMTIILFDSDGSIIAKTISILFLIFGMIVMVYFLYAHIRGAYHVLFDGEEIEFSRKGRKTRISIEAIRLFSSWSSLFFVDISTSKNVIRIPRTKDAAVLLHSVVKCSYDKRRISISKDCLIDGKSPVNFLRFSSTIKNENLSDLTDVEFHTVGRYARGSIIVGYRGTEKTAIIKTSFRNQADYVGIILAIAFLSKKDVLFYFY